jgi:predicted protein tyrosine phosphatase
MVARSIGGPRVKNPFDNSSGAATLRRSRDAAVEENDSMRLLFVCSRNRLRSPTAEAIFSGVEGVEAMSAGTSPDAETPVTADLVEWADLVLVMESVHRKRLKARFGALLKEKRIVVLGIPDKYKYMEPALVDLFLKKVRRYLRS